MSASFTNQVLAQIELHANAEKIGKNVLMLPKQLDEEVARLHLDAPSGTTGATGAPGAAGQGGRGRGGPQRPLVEPGTYEARLTVDGITTRVPVLVRQNPER